MAFQRKAQLELVTMFVSLFRVSLNRNVLFTSDTVDIAAAANSLHLPAGMVPDLPLRCQYFRHGSASRASVGYEMHHDIWK